MEPYLAWLILGFTLVIIEMTTGTFYLLVLGVGCFGAAGAAYLGQGFPVQILIAAVVSGAGAYLVHVYRSLDAPMKMKSLDAGMPARFETWTDQPSGRARVRYRDATWDARVEDRVDLQPGATVYVRSSDGNTLLVGVQPPD
ncbi:MAG: NfeD family protein [Gammaproteobacteria bacterium]|nr:NfeD family protein [Gammaproteobacteria bacterium]